jgi:hypothetical protein
VVERIAALSGGGDEHFEVGLGGLLAREIIEGRGAQRAVHRPAGGERRMRPSSLRMIAARTTVIPLAMMIDHCHRHQAVNAPQRDASVNSAYMVSEIASVSRVRRTLMACGRKDSCRKDRLQQRRSCPPAASWQLTPVPAPIQGRRPGDNVGIAP